MRQSRAHRRGTGVVGVAAILVLASCTARLGQGENCIFNDDCAPPLVCAGRVCRMQCRDSRDCANGWQCTRSDDPGKRVCIAPTLCVYNSECASPLVCARDGTCRESCRGDRDCIIYGPQSRCVEGGCLAPGVDAGALDDGATRPPGDGASTSVDGASTSVDGERGDGPSGDSTGVGADGSMGTDASFDATDGCAAGQRVCGGACVDLTTDSRNCGRCGVTCPDGRVCAAGLCVIPCGGSTCGGALVCSSGTCMASCAMGLSDCQGTCRDLVADDRNCGACGTACATGQACSRSRCCPEGQVTCGGRCTDILTDPANCGDCQRACALPTNTANATCSGGNCGFVCNTRFGDCDRVATNGCEVNIQTDAAHCGRCGRACATGEGCVLGECVGITSVARGNAHVCAVLTTGAVRCWGNNQAGQLGVGSRSGDSTPSPPVTVLRLGGPVAEIAAGGGNNCVRLADQTVQCWGSNFNGQLGTGSTERESLYPATVTGLAHPPTRLAVGESHACALLNDGSVQCWGRNDYGQLGDGTTTQRSTPVSVVSLDGTATHVAAGPLATCAVLQDGSVRCWGNNNSGGLGDGTTTNRAVPTPVVSLGGRAREVQVGNGFACALMEGGTVRCWGANYDGQFGNGAANSGSHTPVNASAVTGTVVELRLGSSHVCARFLDGSVRCWGDNFLSALGDRTTTDSSVPVAPSGLPSGAAQISVGTFQTCARYSDHRIFCWGSGSPVAAATGVYP